MIEASTPGKRKGEPSFAYGITHLTSNKSIAQPFYDAKSTESDYAFTCGHRLANATKPARRHPPSCLSPTCMSRIIKDKAGQSDTPPGPLIMLSSDGRLFPVAGF